MAGPTEPADPKVAPWRHFGCQVEDRGAPTFHDVLVWRPRADCHLAHWELERGDKLNYEKIFADAVNTVRGESRYRVFANLQRLAGEFPYARNHGPGPERVVVWCSNDYLAQGQNPVDSKR